jgi:hypothetical protein
MTLRTPSTLGKNFSFVEVEHALISLFGVFDSFQAQAFGQASRDL